MRNYARYQTVAGGALTLATYLSGMAYGNYKMQRLRPRYGRYGRRNGKYKKETRMQRWQPRKIPRVSFRRGNIASYGAMKPELKWYDTTVAVNSTVNLVSASAGSVSFNTVPQGTGQNQRIGNRIICRSIQCRGYIEVAGVVSTTSASFGNVFRIMIVVDHQSNSTNAAGSEILEDANNANSYRNLLTSQRFTVLWDKIINFNANSITSDGSVGERMSVDNRRPLAYFKKMNMVVQYDGTTADTASISTNNMQIYLMSQDSGPVCTLSLDVRLRYTG